MAFPACYGQEVRILIELMHDRNTSTRPKFGQVVEYLLSVQQDQDPKKEKVKTVKQKINPQLLETASKCGWQPTFDRLFLEKKKSHSMFKNPTRSWKPPNFTAI